MNLIGDVRQDIRLGGRFLLRHRWHSAVIVVTLAFALGSLTAVFSVVRAVLFNAYGPVQIDQWVYLWEHRISPDDGQQISVSIPNFRDWKRESSSVFSEMVLWLPWSYVASGADGSNPEQIRAAVISPDMFTGANAVPAAGRLLLPADSTNNERVVVLSYEFWQRVYGGKTSLVGEKIELNLVPHTVVGIAPKGFGFPPETQTDAWTPVPAAMLSSGTRSGRGFRVAAHLRPGVTWKAAQSAMTLISQRLAVEYPEDKDYEAVAVPMREAVVGDFKTPLISLSGALAFALLLACLNIAYLRGVHLKSRRKEIMLRMALGADRVRLFRQLLMETVLLFGVGGVLGLVISPIAIRALISLVPAGEIPWLHVSTDFFTFLVMFTVCLLAGLASGFIPALAASRTEPARVLGSGGAVSNTSQVGKRMRNAAQVAQIALALVPLCGAGLLIRSFQHLQDVAPGFDTQNRLTVMFAAPKARYATPQQIAFLARRIGQEASHAPGVLQDGIVQALPFAPGARWVQGVTRTDPKGNADLGQLPKVRYSVATSGYFEAMGIRLKAGRTLTEDDDATAQPVVVINEQLARTQFSGENPLGKLLWVGDEGSLLRSLPRVVVGVVADTRMDNLEVVPDPAAWAPIMQQDSGETIFRNLYLVTYTSAAPSSVLGAIRERIHNIDPDLALSDVASMQDRVGDSLWRQRFGAIVVGAFSIVSLLIAIIGVFGMTSYLVASRTFEIGVRMAVGATRLSVMKMILGESTAMALIGVVLGLVGCIAATRVLSTFLFGIKATDPLTLGGVALLLVAVAAGASYIPRAAGSLRRPSCCSPNGVIN